MKTHKKNVCRIFYTEYNEAEAMQLFKRHGFGKRRPNSIGEGHTRRIADNHGILAPPVHDCLILIVKAANAA